jgi:hypothetical protein
MLPPPAGAGDGVGHQLQRSYRFSLVEGAELGALEFVDAGAARKARTPEN